MEVNRSDSPVSVDTMWGEEPAGSEIQMPSQLIAQQGSNYTPLRRTFNRKPTPNQGGVSWGLVGCWVISGCVGCGGLVAAATAFEPQVSLLPEVGLFGLCALFYVCLPVGLGLKKTWNYCHQKEKEDEPLLVDAGGSLSSQEL